ncbi:hypothetical protein K461DRAFT_266987 [Myriangium duriaei CBS 260.36]|uniref:Glutathione S-transferase n=1 Tax=Myriangium duriaei CBS 260.36 TaxID=1168546 RepID=A0A9P4J2E2_9PEZI|nr:hypothetical protein K461DRAFT_266987 [Myriangium duriaei CBS 260.36]
MVVLVVRVVRKVTVAVVVMAIVVVKVVLVTIDCRYRFCCSPTNNQALVLRSQQRHKHRIRTAECRGSSFYRLSRLEAAVHRRHSLLVMITGISQDVVPYKFGYCDLEAVFVDNIAMVQLLESDIQTKEVLGWQGLHVFHHILSSCSQKLRVFLNLKGLKWHSHPIDIVHNEHLKPYYLGINPRGLVPSIVEDGVVHIESNDIILHLDQEYPEPRLVPADRREEVAAILRHEDDLHLDLRTLTFRFLFDPAKPTKSRQDLDNYSAGAGTVQGHRDQAVQREVSFWSDYLNSGVTDQQARLAAARLRTAFDGVEAALAKSSYVLGDKLSIVDIAWLVYVQRLVYVGYPHNDLHPHIAAWRAKLMDQPAIAKELELPQELRGMVADRQRSLTEAGQTLTKVCFPELTTPAASL